ncbi:hypothetical protein KBC79_04540 [Candidatus Woesebacteria bacterium]|nr:hypothetical protein [Candidatus Woesebacteria bacterium]
MSPTLRKPTSTELRIFFSLFAVRLAVFVIGILLFLLINPPVPGQPLSNLAQETWGRWDTRHYLLLSTDGYTNVRDEGYLLVFFPLYPLLIRGLTQVTFLSPYAAGVLLSWIFFSLAGVFIYKLVRLDFDQKTARQTLKYLALFPMSFFFGMAYTESLFLLLLAMFFYFLRKRYLLWAAIVLYLAAITRLQGILLVIPAMVEVYWNWRTHTNRSLWANKRSAIQTAIGFLLFGAMGFGTYLLLNKVVAGNWIEFLHIQKENWHTSFIFFGSVVFNQLSLIGYEKNPALLFGTWLPQLLMFVLSIGMIGVGYFKKVRLSYLAHWTIHLLISFSASWLLSGVRFMLPIFFLYLVLALSAKSKLVDAIITITLALLLSTSIVLFLQNGVL